MPTRTQLPRNLTRHFYEARRAFLKSAGQETTPWFQLPPEERAVVESELGIFRLAIRWAEDEEDLLASLDATRAAVADEPAAEEPQPDAAAEENAPDCCVGCAAVAAVLKLIGAPNERLEASLGWDVGSDGQGATAVAVRVVPFHAQALGAPLSDEEAARAKKDAREALDQWVALGKPLKEVTPDPRLFDARPISVERLLVNDFPSSDVRAEFRLRKPPTADKA
ncbi:hypothetical protein [Streptomyces cahuitamycinicus]|uniref:Uncharacterized protein n=1 Tax=Streptomyces cahuitamycinicus TaxID=2070367 RepID=A0A2N8TTH8_9ACTN|nr:hypothetical protein [Streptomyces cahuitamycinicus]PNG22325.1 hypothetical protein C1J00_09935 [Streptomyces cahuitamycinicus]